MIVPDDITLDELIGALKVEIARQKIPTDEMLGMSGHLIVLETVRRELGRKQGTQEEYSPDYCKDCLNGTHPAEARK